ncbi:hypothetical protein SAMN05428983_4823 [Agrobacterium fabrum]|uniref:Uncharacterized protein n=1 Tax=Agrobacterium fabrum TaxID=1176649 RepID=A0A7Z7BSJ2_9HYPH|nr:hypothetical protein SAMN05428983_4823 [Agrobacterium fabrum]
MQTNDDRKNDKPVLTVSMKRLAKDVKPSLTRPECTDTV